MMNEILIESSIDHTQQPSLYFHPDTPDPVPLVVGLHTWSYDRFNQEQNYLHLCREHRFALLLPEFRGPNLNSNPRKNDACGSEKARRDVIDAVDHVCKISAIDRSSIFLLGCSGGGHMALLAAETAPELFRAVEIWCPVSDLVQWHKFLAETHQNYIHHIEACLGGTPEEFPEEYASRSPVTHLKQLKNLPVSIHHGRHDTVVPFQHSRRLAEILESAGNAQVYLDIFDGGHEQIPSHSFEWFAKLAGKRSGMIGITG